MTIAQGRMAIAKRFEGDLIGGYVAVERVSGAQSAGRLHPPRLDHSLPPSS